MKNHFFASMALCSTLIATGAQAGAIDNALVIVNSGSVQTQGMAMVLANAMQAKGTRVNVLLCDQAGDLALKSTISTPLKPKNVTPEQLMSKLKKGGAEINVCALYLPNSEHAASDLRDGVGVAKPPAIADQMVNADLRVFNF